MNTLLGPPSFGADKHIDACMCMDNNWYRLGLLG